MHFLLCSFFCYYFIQYIYFTFISLNKMASKKFYNSTLCAGKNAILEEWYGHFESSHRNLSTMNKMLVNIAIIHHFYYFFFTTINIQYSLYILSFLFSLFYLYPWNIALYWLSVLSLFICWFLVFPLLLPLFIRFYLY